MALTNKEVIDMTRDEFIAEYYKVSAKATQLSETARKCGLLALEDFIDFEKADQRDILEFGLKFVVDGVDREYIDGILSNIIRQEEDKYTRLLLEIKKEAVLKIQVGINDSLLAYFLNSHTDIPLTDDPIYQKFKDEKDDKGIYSNKEIDAFIEEIYRDVSNG
jgi:flagellar motor component MotA